MLLAFDGFHYAVDKFYYCTYNSIENRFGFTKIQLIGLKRQLWQSAGNLTVHRQWAWGVALTLDPGVDIQPLPTIIFSSLPYRSTLYWCEVVGVAANLNGVAARVTSSNDFPDIPVMTTIKYF